MARRKFASVFGTVVRQRRIEKGLSQELLAEMADIHRNYVGMLERGECAATLDVADQLARALGESLAGLINEASAQYDRQVPPTKRKLSSRRSSPAR